MERTPTYGPGFYRGLDALSQPDQAALVALAISFPDALVALVLTEENGEILNARVSSPIRTPGGDLAQSPGEAFTSSTPVWSYFRAGIVPRGLSSPGYRNPVGIDGRATEEF